MIKFMSILCLIGAAVALVEVDQLPNELRELIPEKLKDIYQKLSKDEKEAYHRVHEKLMWPDNVLEEMKTTDEMLWEKMKKFRSFFKDDIDQLTQRGRDFFEKLANAYADFSKGDQVRMDKAKQEMRWLLELYQGLDEWDVNVVKTSFPSIYKAFEGKQLKTFAGYEAQKEKEVSSEEQEGKKNLHTNVQ